MFESYDRNYPDLESFNKISQFFSFSPKLVRILIIGVPAVGGLKFSMAQKNFAKGASWGKCQFGDKNLTLGRTIFFQFCRR